MEQHSRPKLFLLAGALGIAGLADLAVLDLVAVPAYIDGRAPGRTEAADMSRRAPPPDRTACRESRAAPTAVVEGSRRPVELATVNPGKAPAPAGPGRVARAPGTARTGAPEPAAAPESAAAHARAEQAVAIGADEPVASPPVLIFFGTGSAALPANGRRELCSLARRAGRSGSRLQVVGHADARGSEERNQELGLRRACRVSRQLLACGFPAARLLRPETRGSREPLVNRDDPEAWSTNRRAEVLEVTGAASPSAGAPGD